MRRIHNYAVVGFASSLFSLGKFFAVVNDISHGRVSESGKAKVFLCGIYHSARSIDMAYLRARGAAEAVAPPVYANILSTRGRFSGFFDTAERMIPENQSQFTACSGKSPVCLKPIGRSMKFRSPYDTVQFSGILRTVHSPASRF